MRLARTYATAWEHGIQPDTTTVGERTFKGREQVEDRWNGHQCIWRSWSDRAFDEILDQIRTGGAAYPDLVIGTVLVALRVDNARR